MYLLVPLQIDPEIDKAQYIFYKSNTFKNQKNGKELLLTQIAFYCKLLTVDSHKHPHTDGDAHATTQLHYSLLLPCSTGSTWYIHSSYIQHVKSS